MHKASTEEVWEAGDCPFCLCLDGNAAGVFKTGEWEDVRQVVCVEKGFAGVWLDGAASSSDRWNCSTMSWYEEPL